MSERDSPHPSPPQAIPPAQTVYFLLARPTADVDRLPSTIGERDVFASEEQALDALDIHYAWCRARYPDGDVADSAQWFLQSATVGPRLTPGLGEVYLAAVDEHTGTIWAAAGGFLTEGEVVHWAPFVRAARPWGRATGGDGLELAYRGDTAVHFGRLWFVPMHSARVHPRPIIVGE
ncbi:MAG: hypothetical protein QM662_05960 [Gordonia sp. (in: high G+C Gram-positive bacteria)]